MTNYPLVSVIIPNYNYSKYLDQRINSILNQTYENYELILLDDCSTDNSRCILEKYRNNPKVSHVVYNAKNSGSPFKQWEKGIQLAEGDIIWIAESDDLCSNIFLETLIKSYIESKVVLCFCRSELIDQNGNHLRDNFQMSSMKSNLTISGDSFIRNYLGYRNEIQNASSAIFDKNMALSISKDYMNYKGAGDWFFWIEMAEKGDVFFCNKTLNQYRLHDNTTKSLVKNGIEFRETKSIIDWLSQKGYLPKSAYRNIRLNNLLLIDSLDYIPSDVKKELFALWNMTSFTKLEILFEKFCIKLKSVFIK